jgi:integrase
MNQLNSLDSETKIQGSEIRWAERLTDHENKIAEYLDNCLFRGCSVESTFNERRVVLHSIFRRVKIDDLTHPTGRRHLLLWDLLSPTFGSHYLSLIVSSLFEDDLALATSRKYMNDLRYVCEYVLAKPHIPSGNGVRIPDKYGPIAAPFTKYDLPIHAADTPRRKRYALTPPLRDDFFEFLRVEHVPHCSLPHIGARNLTAIILQAEIGMRNCELLGIRSEGDSCDIDRLKGRVRIFGKGSAYSGKRLRSVPLTPLATEVLNTFEKVFKPMFPKSPYSDYLFLNEDGSRLTKYWYWKTFRKIVDLARDAGVQIPEDLRPHDLRRTFATNELERNPLGYRKVLKHLGHSYPSSAAPYLIATDEDVEEEQGDLIDIFVDPYINKRGKS